MPRPRRKRRPPGNVHVCCTGRGSHDLVTLPPPLQLYADGDRVRIRWNSHQGDAPVTGFRGGGEGLQTFEFQCTSCRRHWKRNKDNLVAIALTLAREQGISGDDNTPIRMDISMIERA